MISGRIWSAARRRIDYVHGDRDDREDGFALILVMLISLVITIGVATALTVVGSNIVPAKHSQDNEAATATAQSGIERYVAWVNAQCGSFNSQACAAVAGDHPNGSGVVTGTVKGVFNQGTASFKYKILNSASYVHDGFVRIRSTGTAGTATRTLTADITGAPNILRFAYLTKYETLSSDFINSYYPARTVKIAPTFASSADAASPALSSSATNTVTWAAPGSSDTTGSQICDRLWYDDGATRGRSTLKSTFRSTLPIATDWSQSGNDGTLSLPCEVTFTTGMSFNGPVYTRDAPYLSYGTGGSTATKGPTFTIPAAESLPPVSTGWDTSSTPAASNFYRPFPILLGAPSSSSSLYSTGKTVQHAVYDLQLNNTADDARGVATCVYTGPTRIVVTGSTAKIMSPLTPTGTGACYTNTDTTISGTGVSSASVPVASTIIYVQNLGSQNAWTKATTGSVFGLTSGTPDVGRSVTTTSAIDANVSSAGSSGSTADGAWTLNWTANSACGTALAPKPADQKNFECELATSAPVGATSTYAGFRTKAESLLGSQAVTASLSTDLKTALDSTFTYYGTPFVNSSPTPPTTGTLGNYRYIVTPSASDTTVSSPTNCPQTPGTMLGLTNASLQAPSSDAFLGNRSNGTENRTITCAETQANATVVRQLYGCYVLATGLLDATTTKNKSCTAILETAKWGSGSTSALSLLNGGIAQFSVTASRYVQNTTYSLATSGKASWPIANDITPYSSWSVGKTDAPGDAYVEGSGITSALSVVAQHDLVVTGKTTTVTTPPGTAPLTDASTGEPAWVSGGALALVGQNNVRLYHPVSCATANDGTTTWGCPNDLTGLYNNDLESGGALSTKHPALQYCNMTAATTGGSTASNSGNSACDATNTANVTGTGPISEVDAAVFALGGTALAGSLYTDNFNRGTGMSAVQVVGGIYMLHRGATGQQWETQASDSTRVQSGYVLQDRYLDLQGAGLPYVPATQNGNSTRAWNIVSISSDNAAVTG